MLEEVVHLGNEVDQEANNSQQTDQTTDERVEFGLSTVLKLHRRAKKVL